MEICTLRLYGGHLPFVLLLLSTLISSYLGDSLIVSVLVGSRTQTSTTEVKQARDSVLPPGRQNTNMWKKASQLGVPTWILREWHQNGGTVSKFSMVESRAQEHCTLNKQWYKCQVWWPNQTSLCYGFAWLPRCLGSHGFPPNFQLSL